MPNTCKATTKSGKPCKLKASTNGFCHLHDPVQIKQRKQQRRETERRKAEQAKPLKEIIEVVKNVCTAKGWNSYVDTLDNKNWEFATLNIYRYFQNRELAGFIEIDVGSTLRLYTKSTSIYSFGIESLNNTIWSKIKQIDWVQEKYDVNPEKEKHTNICDQALADTERIINRFREVAQQLTERYSKRETLIVRDEYDVQDLLHALLKIYFDDVRPEEYVPSYAGRASRVDFLLKNEKIVIEVKMARENLKDEKIGEELIIDIERYKSHPNCRALICFVYDPDRWIKNPIGLQKDLSSDQDFIVKVFVVR